MSARVLAAYAPRALFDFVLTRGTAMVVIALVFLSPALFSEQFLQMPVEQQRGFLSSTLLGVGPALTLVATFG
ncbi:MAG: hypothetical protein D6701_01355, partial [Gemmatimonadetes bacterium]